MSGDTKEGIEQVRAVVHDVLAGRASKVFMSRIDSVLHEWEAGTLNAMQAIDKIKKVVVLFISEDLAKEIGDRCAPIVMRGSAGKK